MTGPITRQKANSSPIRPASVFRVLAPARLALLALVACAGSAHAQDALGDGTALGTGTTLTTGTSQPGAVRPNSYQSNLVQQSQRRAVHSAASLETSKFQRRAFGGDRHPAPGVNLRAV